jgi:DNA-binding transcriptional MocR family regulator
VGLEQAGTVAVVDETLVELGLDAAAPVPFAAVAPPHAVVTVGSTSKAFWGGLRIGWLRAEPDVVQRCARVLSGTQLALPVLEQLAACHLLDGAEAALASSRSRLREQRAALLGALADRLPAWQVRPPAGGLVLWCQLPAGSSTALAAGAEPHGLRLAAGPRFSPSAGCDDRLRLPVHPPRPVLEEAVRRLADLVAATGSARPRRPPRAGWWSERPVLA